jgi:hypothetical protein
MRRNFLLSHRDSARRFCHARTISQSRFYLFCEMFLDCFGLLLFWTLLCRPTCRGTAKTRALKTHARRMIVSIVTGAAEARRPVFRIVLADRRWCAAAPSPAATRL